MKLLGAGEIIKKPEDKEKRLYWCFEVGMDPESVGRGRGYRCASVPGPKPERTLQPPPTPFVRRPTDGLHECRFWLRV